MADFFEHRLKFGFRPFILFPALLVFSPSRFKRYSVIEISSVHCLKRGVPNHFVKLSDSPVFDGSLDLVKINKLGLALYLAYELLTCLAEALTCSCMHVGLGYVKLGWGRLGYGRLG